MLEAGDLPTLFGEDQARYLLAVGPESVEGILAAAGEDAVTATVVGRIGGAEMRLGGEAVAMKDLVGLWRAAFERELV